MQTKGTMVKDLKAAGVRKAVKHTGETVSLEHLKTYEVATLWFEHCAPVQD